MSSESEALAWAAGFWDGEGCVYLAMFKKQPPIPVFSLTQAGEEAVMLMTRFLESTDMHGTIHPVKSPEGHKPRWSMRIQGATRVAELLERCDPWLSETKREQALRVLNEAATSRAEWNTAKEARVPTHCPNGHEWTEDNTYRYKRRNSHYPHRQCRTCRREGMRRYYQARQKVGSSNG